MFNGTEVGFEFLLGSKSRLEKSLRAVSPNNFTISLRKGPNYWQREGLGGNRWVVSQQGEVVGCSPQLTSASQAVSLGCSDRDLRSVTQHHDREGFRYEA